MPEHFTEQIKNITNTMELLQRSLITLKYFFYFLINTVNMLRTHNKLFHMGQFSIIFGYF